MNTYPQIINSLLDNDFYKFTMQNAVTKLFPKAMVRYRFVNRGGHVFPEGFAQALRQEVKMMENLSLTEEEKSYFSRKCPYLDPVYMDFLSGYHFDSSEVHIEQNGGDLSVMIEGYWYRTILWEVPLMSVISELYYIMTGQKRVDDQQVKAITRAKMEAYKDLDIKIAEFGSRRRHSYRVQEMVVEELQRCGGKNYIGTSNVRLAMDYNVIPIGTHAHEWFMFHAAYYGYRMANRMGLDNWVNVYRGDLGIALSDTFTTDVFIHSFDKKFAKLFDGVRHDSGDPIAFTDKIIEHYRHYNIDPRSKTIIFSDALTPDVVAKIANYCRGKIGMSFGIGTNFTNDVGLEALNMVIKMSDVFTEGTVWTHTVKLSDSEGKYTGDPKAITLAKDILGIE
ncbi:MAG: nicotinate phosphoribosyltransferase [Flavobacteriales bacterium]|nr:nicotinate phosphoribosyltransferase [Flavobacteriales bacterium]